MGRTPVKNDESGAGKVPVLVLCLNSCKVADPSFLAVARICSRFVRLTEYSDSQRPLAGSAVGFVFWYVDFSYDGQGKHRIILASA
jgi:hypothetical protein